MYDPIYKRFQKFLNNSERAHGDRYNYESVQYVNAKTPVIIVCDEHGEFLQTPTKHILGHGCQMCGGTKKLTTGTFIEKATKKHNGRYTYPNAEYKGYRDSVLIECSVHGEFKQTVFDHLRGCGCTACDGTFKHDRNQFIRGAKEVHGDTYDYSPSIYRTNKIKLDILCQYHGTFSQTPNAHLRGQGCPSCKKIGLYCETIFERSPEKKIIPCTFYVVRFETDEETFLKVGITTKTAKQRFTNGGYKGCTVVVLSEHNMKLYQAYKLEQSILRTLPSMTPKIKFGCYTECLPVDQLAKIQDIVDKKFYLT